MSHPEDLLTYQMRANPEHLPGQDFNVSGIWMYSVLQFIFKPGIHIQACFHLMFKRWSDIKTMNGRHSTVNTESYRVYNVYV